MSNKLVVGFFTLIYFLAMEASASNFYRDVGDPIATVYSIDEHQSGSQVWWIDQLDDGQMVFATANGLTAWDGENWQRASSSNNTRMRSLSIWTDGNIYAGATNELGYFVKQSTGEFRFTLIPTKHLTTQFGQTRGVNSNDAMVVYNTDECAFVWNGTTIVKVDGCVAKGSRVFNIDGQLLITDRKKIYQIEISNNVALAIEKPWQFPPNIRIKSLFLNAQEQIIMVSNMHGVFRLEDNSFIQVVSPESLPINALSSGIQGTDKYYYLNSTINGLMVLSENFELLRHYQQNDGLGLATTYNVFQDKQDNIWLAGLPNISVFQPPHLRSQYRNDTGTLDFENIYTINGRMFFSGTGIYQLHYPSKPYFGPMFKKIPDFDHVVMDAVGNGNELIVGTDRGVYSFEFNAEDMNSIPRKPTRISSDNFVSDLAVVPDKSAIFATINTHLSKLEKIQQQWHETRLLEDNSGTEYLTIEDLSSDANLNQYAVWVAADSRDIYRVSNDNDNSDTYNIRRFAQQDTPLGKEHILPFVYQNTLMIGTENGVYSYQEGETDVFTPVSSLPASLRTKRKDVFRTLADQQGRLWYHAGRDTGVVYKDGSGDLVSQENIFKPYNNSGTRGLAYFNHAIWFGVTNGSLYRMSEDVIGAVPPAAQVSIRYINNIDTNLPFTIAKTAAAIPNDKNSIRIGYALPDYSGTRKTQYRTRINGQGHSNWTLWSNESSKDFPLLGGGNWLFEVEAIDPWGRTSNTEYSFNVEYPWYLSVVAWMCYALALILVIVVSIKIGQSRRNKTLEKQNVDLECKVLERTNEINQKVDELNQLHILKDRFFANVSHEFRTPLTLTIGPLQELINKHRKSIGKESLHLSLTALSNAKKMLALVGQVLDLNRLELGTQPLRVSEFDIATLLNANAERFKPWAEQQNQTIGCSNCENPYLLHADQDQVDKCVSNLLSNAINYSGANTHINIEIVCQTNRVGIRVSDNGVGLPKALQQKVFERFYQADLESNENRQGSGIGLNLVKEITSLHHGEVELITQLNQGCQFTLWFLKGGEHFSSDELIEPIYLLDSVDLPNIPAYDINLDKATVLIVDDNPSLRQFMSQVLSANYQILEAENGEQGIAWALKYLPDIIISDVSMPGISGLELTGKLKSQPETSSILILLLSAQTTKRDIVAGFSRGANDYLIKPFDTSELVMRINALLNNYKDKPTNTPELIDSLSQQIKSSDSFDSKLNSHIIENISNVEFGLETLAELLFMSKETLRRKCNASMQMSPTSYIRKVRIEQGKLLLENQLLNVSEVAYAVGFESLAYFSKSFKKHYGISPSGIVKVAKK
jgi:signal transduction histidine kinase/CheY-like chemotaxis protein/AraC-like DNA-binding protein/ligand-binding sensor domain-containing protein